LKHFFSDIVNIVQEQDGPMSNGRSCEEVIVDPTPSDMRSVETRILGILVQAEAAQDTARNGGGVGASQVDAIQAFPRILWVSGPAEVFNEYSLSDPGGTQDQPELFVLSDKEFASSNRFLDGSTGEHASAVPADRKWGAKQFPMS